MVALKGLWTKTKIIIPELIRIFIMLKTSLALLGLLVSLSANATILKFTFNGTTEGFFGPVKQLSGSFLLDTSAITSLVMQPTDDGFGNIIPGFTFTGSVYNASLQLGDAWSLNGAATYNFESQGPVQELFTNNDGIGGLHLHDMHGSGRRITLEEWNNSSDPIADYFMYFGNHFDLPFFIDGLDNSVYLSGSAGGNGELFISQVPVPAATWSFGSALIGLIGIKRKK